MVRTKPASELGRDFRDDVWFVQGVWESRDHSGIPCLIQDDLVLSSQLLIIATRGVVRECRN